MAEVPRMRTIQQTADATGLSYHCVRKLCMQHKVIAFQSGRKWLVNLDKFIEYLNNPQEKQTEIAATAPCKIRRLEA